jgi:hypothetical protein
VATAAESRREPRKGASMLVLQEGAVAGAF